MGDVPPVPPSPPLLLPSDPEPGLLVGREPPLGEEVGSGDGLDVGVRSCTGAATPGGTTPLDPRSCCHDQPTDPPAGTTSPPTPEVEKVHEPEVPLDHHRPQYAFSGEVFTHGSVAGVPFTRHTKPGERWA